MNENKPPIITSSDSSDDIEVVKKVYQREAENALFNASIAAMLAVLSEVTGQDALGLILLGIGLANGANWLRFLLIRYNR